MGIPTDPGYKLYVGSACGQWGSGKTPKKLYCSLAGIELGPDWVSSVGPAPNALVLLEHVFECNWRAVLRQFEISYYAGPDGSSLQVFGFPAIMAFMSYTPENGAASFANQNSLSPLYFQGGTATVVQRCPKV